MNIEALVEAVTKEVYKKLQGMKLLQEQPIKRQKAIIMDNQAHPEIRRGIPSHPIQLASNKRSGDKLQLYPRNHAGAECNPSFTDSRAGARRIFVGDTVWQRKSKPGARADNALLRHLSAGFMEDYAALHVELGYSLRL